MAKAKQWICPVCGRNFSRKNQAHSCETYTEEYHLSKADVDTKAIYHSLISEIKQFGPVHLEYMKNIIVHQMLLNGI